MSDALIWSLCLRKSSGQIQRKKATERRGYPGQKDDKEGIGLTTQGKIWDETKRGDIMYQYLKMIIIRDSIQFGDRIGNLEIGKNSGFWGDIANSVFNPGIILIPLFLVLLINMKVAVHAAEWQEEALGRKHSKEILGFFAVCIVLHHLVQQIGAENAGILSLLEDMGVCFVGFYFFFSGYGLIQSYHGKQDYLKGFFKKRLPAILIPFYVCIMVFLVYELCSGKKYGVMECLAFLSGISLLNGHMWYIIEIFFLYLFFWISFRFCKKEKYACICMFSICFLMVMISLFLGHDNKWFHGEWWYNTTMLFPLGMLFARYEKNILSFVRKYYIPVFVLIASVYVILMKATLWMLEHYGYWTEYAGRTGMNGYMDKLKTLSLQLPMVIVFVFLIILMGQKVKCSNAVLRFLGEISLELYLIHNLFIGIFSKISQKTIYFTVVLLSSIAAAALLHWLNKKLICVIQKKRLPKGE